MKRFSSLQRPDFRPLERTKALAAANRGEKTTEWAAATGFAGGAVRGNLRGGGGNLRGAANSSARVQKPQASGEAFRAVTDATGRAARAGGGVNLRGAANSSAMARNPQASGEARNSSGRPPKSPASGEASHPAKSPADAELTNDIRVYEDEKFSLFASEESQRKISAQTAVKAFCIYFILIIICSAFVFVRELIYDLSKEYADLSDQKEQLIEENKQLAMKIEALQFKNKISNYFDVQYE